MELLPPPPANGEVVLTAELIQCLDVTKRLLQRGLDEDVPLRFCYAEQMMTAVFRGMRLLDVPPRDRQAWLESIGRRSLAKERRRTPGEIDWNECTHLQTRVAELLLEDGQTELAKEVIVRLQSEMPARYLATAYSDVGLIRAGDRQGQRSPTAGRFQPADQPDREANNTHALDSISRRGPLQQPEGIRSQQEWEL